MDSLKEDMSAAFLFNLGTGGGLVGVPRQLCCLWQGGWKTDLQAKHLIGLAGFFRGLLQWAHDSQLEKGWSEPLKFSLMTAWLNFEML